MQHHRVLLRKRGEAYSLAWGGGCLRLAARPGAFASAVDQRNTHQDNHQPGNRVDIDLFMQKNHAPNDAEYRNKEGNANGLHSADIADQSEIQKIRYRGTDNG
ncbi:hypothetical protein D3C75_797640 [compost metagenome]